MSGFIIQLMVNRRMGLSDHLVGTMGGMFLAILGLIWSHLRMWVVETSLEAVAFAEPCRERRFRAGDLTEPA